MTWFKVDDSLAFHHKTVAAGNAAMGLWVRAGSWSAQQLSDGYIPANMARLLGSKRDAESLVAVGLWEAVDGGYRFHQWAERNPTRDSVESKREEWRDKKARQRRTSGGQYVDPPGDSTGVSPGDTSGDSSGESHRTLRAVPSRPVPDIDESMSVGAADASPRKTRRKPSRPLPDDWAPTPAHATKARELGISLEREVGRFRAHAQANDRRQVDWDAAFRLWLDRAPDMGGASSRQDQPRPGASVWDRRIDTPEVPHA